jgi:hypothetical protein
MLHSIVEDVDLCEELKVSPSQLMFIKLLVSDPALDTATRKKNAIKLSLRYKDVTGGLAVEEMIDLISRDIVIDYNDAGKCQYDYYEINPKFASKFELKVYPMSFELQDAYPARFKGSDGKLYLGSNVSAEEIAMDYIRAIDNNLEEHKEVMKDLAWGVENSAIILGLKKFVLTRYWKVLREARLKKVSRVSTLKIS